MTDPLGTATFTYYAGGELKSATDRLGRRRDFAYDGQSRLTTETWFATVTDTLALATMTASYDENGNQLTAANAAGIYTMQYDALDRVTGVLAPFSTRLTFSYDAVGNRTVVQDSKGGIETSIFDKADQLVTRTLGLSGKTLQAEFSYRDNGLVQKQTRKNNTGGGLNLVGTTSYLYDGANRVTAIDAYDSGNTLRTSFVYNYNGVNLTSKVDNGTATTYSYHEDNQLYADGSSTFTLDEAGNRTNGPGGAYLVDDGNRVTSSHGGDWEYRYDDEGNQTAKLSNSNTTWWTYGYDHRNQLISAQEWNANPEIPGTPLVIKEVEYKYDWYGNRVQTDVDSDGDEDIDSSEKYALDYWGASGYANVWADLDSGSSLTTRYLRGDGADELLGRADSGGMPSWLLTDHLGSVRNVTDSTGALTLTVTYDAWGNTSDTGNAAGRYQWTGRERDVETELQYNRARWYDASTGRWMSQDPLGFDAGDSNLYRYVKNRPTGATDPSGMGENDLGGQGTYVSNGAKMKGGSGPLLAAPPNTTVKQPVISPTDPKSKGAMQPLNLEKAPIVPQVDQSQGKLVGMGVIGLNGNVTIQTTDRGGMKQKDNSPGLDEIQFILDGGSLFDGKCPILSMLGCAFAFARGDDEGGAARLPLAGGKLILGMAAAISPSGKFTEPQLPPKTIVTERGVTIEHFTRSNDHLPPHAHVSGQGPSTRIGENGRPLAGDPALSARQSEVIQDNLPAIRSALDAIRRWWIWRHYRQGN